RFIDRRTSTGGRWDEVESIAFAHGGRGEVTVAVLTLRRPVTSWRRDWLTPLIVAFPRPDNEIRVLISGLKYPDWKIEELMRSLVGRHGGKEVRYRDMMAASAISRPKPSTPPRAPAP